MNACRVPDSINTVTSACSGYCAVSRSTTSRTQISASPSRSRPRPIAASPSDQAIRSCLATLNDSSGFHIRDVQFKAFPDNILVAIWRGQQIGAVIINPYHVGSLPENAWSIFSSGVLPQFRRRGVATLLYDAVEKYLAEMGYELGPSPATGLSEDGLGRGHCHSRRCHHCKNSRPPRCLAMLQALKWDCQNLFGVGDVSSRLGTTSCALDGSNADFDPTDRLAAGDGD